MAWDAKWQVCESFPVYTIGRTYLPDLPELKGVKALVQIQHELLDIDTGTRIKQRMHEHSLLHEGKPILAFGLLSHVLQCCGCLTANELFRAR
jgi:hypothetical protein